VSGQGNDLHFVPDGARELAERRRWQAEKLLHAALAPIGGARPVFARVLERALARARRGEAGFWLPMAFAVQRFGSRLELSVPTAAIEHVVLDGVAAGGRRLHTGHWLIGAGDWSPILWPIGRHQVSREAAELLAQDLCFRDTTVYRHYRLRAQGGRPMVRNRVALDSVERIDAYFERFVALFRSRVRWGWRLCPCRYACCMLTHFRVVLPRSWCRWWRLGGCVNCATHDENIPRI